MERLCPSIFRQRTGECVPDLTLFIKDFICILVQVNVSGRDGETVNCKKMAEKKVSDICCLLL